MMSKAALEFSTSLIHATRSAVAGAGAHGVGALLDAAVRAGVADHAGVSRCDPAMARSFLTMAPTHDLVRSADRLQLRHRQGPFFDIQYSDGVLTSPDVGVDPRWATWGPSAAALGIGGVMSVGLHVGHEQLGVLNLYSTATGQPSPGQLARAALVGTAVSIVLAHFREPAGLMSAVEGRVRIGQAQGILMQEQTLTAGDALNLLSEMSHDCDTTLTDLAAMILATRDR